MQFTDAVAVAGTRRTADGYLIADARAVRTGIQVYAGAEVGRPDLAQVRVYRSEGEVRSADSLRSFSHAPITIGHPAVPVTADNWRELSVGEVSTAATWDGNRISLPLILKDAAAVRAAEDGLRELSAGYTCDLDWTPGTTADGQVFDAQQKNIRANHLAMVPRGRAGPECRIGDAEPHAWGIAPLTTHPQQQRDALPMKTLVIDGHPVALDDAAFIVVSGLQREVGRLTADNLRLDADANTAKAERDADAKKKDDEIAALKKAGETKDGEIAVLTKKVEDAALTPAKLDAAVAARAAVVGAAKAVLGDAYKADGKTEAEIRREAVVAKLGDARAKAMSDDNVFGAFQALTADAKPTDPLRSVFVDGIVPPGDAQQRAADAHAKRQAALRDAWKGPTAGAA